MNRPNRIQTLIERLLYSGYFYSEICYSGHFFSAPHENFGQNSLLNNRHPMTGSEKRKHMHVFNRHISLL